MTIDYYSDAQLDAIAALDVNLADDSSIQTAQHADAMEVAEEARQAEADRADAERDRADGAEAHARALLAEVVWRRATELGYDPDRLRYYDAESAIVDSLYEDMEGGVKAADLSPDKLLHDWFGGAL